MACIRSSCTTSLHFLYKLPASSVPTKEWEIASAVGESSIGIHTFIFFSPTELALHMLVQQWQYDQLVSRERWLRELEARWMRGEIMPLVGIYTKRSNHVYQEHMSEPPVGRRRSVRLCIELLGEVLERTIPYMDHHPLSGQQCGCTATVLYCSCVRVWLCGRGLPHTLDTFHMEWTSQ